jgi:hypothetical protein
MSASILARDLVDVFSVRTELRPPDAGRQHSAGDNVPGKMSGQLDVALRVADADRRSFSNPAWLCIFGMDVEQRLFFP